MQVSVFKRWIDTCIGRVLRCTFICLRKLGWWRLWKNVWRKWQKGWGLKHPWPQILSRKYTCSRIRMSREQAEDMFSRFVKIGREDMSTARDRDASLCRDQIMEKKTKKCVDHRILWFSFKSLDVNRMVF